MRAAIDVSLRRCTCAGSLLVASLAAAASPAADGLVERFEGSRPTLHRQLRASSLEARLAALDALAEFPLAEAARMVHGCFADADEPVRRRAYIVLLSMNGEQDVCDALLELAGQTLRDRQGPRLAPPALAALLASNLPKAQIGARRFLDDILAESPRGVEIALALTDALGARAQTADVAPLARLSASRLFAEHFAVRRGVVAALTRIPAKESIAALIGLMDRAGGEARADAAAHLTRVTGQLFDRDPAAWQRWWAQEGTAFAYPLPGAHVALRRATESEAGQYYGLPLFAERLVFVFDTSGSMSGARATAAKRELVRAIQGLPPYVYFGVVAYNRQIHPWRKEMVPADAANKLAAVQFVESRSPHSDTASYDALAASLSYDTEAIYFLSDGAPTAGKIIAPADIVAAIGAANRTRRISIYTIGIAPGFPGSPTDVFLQALAEQNMGQYRRIDP